MQGGSARRREVRDARTAGGWWGGGRTRVPPSKVSWRHTATRASVGVTPSARSSARGQLRAEGDGRREAHWPRRGPGSQRGPVRKVPGPRSRVHWAPRGGAAARRRTAGCGRPGAGLIAGCCPSRAGSPRPARARSAAATYPTSR